MAGLTRALTRRVSGFSLSTRDPKTPHQYEVSRLHFLFFWTSAFVSHLISALYLLIMAATHFLLLIAPGFVQLTQVTRDFVLVGVIFLLLSCLHASRVISMILHSIRAKKLAFGPPPAPPTQAPVASDPTLDVTNANRLIADGSRLWNRLTRGPRRFWRKYLSPHGLFGVFGPYYDRRIGLRDLVDVPSHVVQAYYMSFFVQPYPCVLVAFVVMCECMSHLVLHSLLRGHSDFTRRANMVLWDMILDAILGAVVPIALILPQMLQYTYHAASVNMNYSDVWYSETVLRLQQVVVKDVLDLATKICPFCFNYWTLSTFSTLFSMHLLQQQQQQQQDATRITSFTLFYPIARWTQIHPTINPNTTLLTAVAPSTPSSAASSAATATASARAATAAAAASSSQSERKDVSRYLAASRFYRWFSALVGIGIFAVSLSASGLIVKRDACDPGCLLHTAPWLSSNCYCVVQQFDCRLVGEASNMTNKLLQYKETDSLNIVVFNHCKQLEIPRAIQRFHALIGISIYNSELVEWSADASITSEAFPVMSYVLLIKTNLSIIPPGLLTNITSTLVDIEIIASSIPPAFPPDVATAWTNVQVLYLEGSEVVEIPEPILQLPRLTQLSLARNKITQVPDDLFRRPVFQTLEMFFLSANPIESIPSGIDAAEKLRELYVDLTALETLPPRSLNSTLAVSAWNASLCDTMYGKVVDTAGYTIACDGLYGNWFRLGVYPLDPEVKKDRIPAFLSTLV